MSLICCFRPMPAIIGSSGTGLVSHGPAVNGQREWAGLGQCSLCLIVVNFLQLFRCRSRQKLPIGWMKPGWLSGEKRSTAKVLMLLAVRGHGRDHMVMPRTSSTCIRFLCTGETGTEPGRSSTVYPAEYGALLRRTLSAKGSREPVTKTDIRRGVPAG